MKFNTPKILVNSIFTCIFAFLLYLIIIDPIMILPTVISIVIYAMFITSVEHNITFIKTKCGTYGYKIEKNRYNEYVVTIFKVNIFTYDKIDSTTRNTWDSDTLTTHLQYHINEIDDIYKKDLSIEQLKEEMQTWKK